jgi:major vault protein
LLQSAQTFTDVYDNERKAGEQWLITNAVSSMHIIDVYEQFIEKVNITILSEDEFCYIRNPVDDKGKNQLGNKILVVGPKSFFVQPGENIEGGIQKVFILAEDEALLLRAEETHLEGEKT